MEEQLKLSAKSQTSGQSREHRVSKIRLGGQQNLFITIKYQNCMFLGVWLMGEVFPLLPREQIFPQLIKLHLGNEGALTLFVMEVERTVAGALQSSLSLV